MNSGLNNWNSLTKRVLLLFVTASYSGGHYICVLNTAHFSRASKASIFNKNYKDKTNSTFKSWKCCYYVDFEGMNFDTWLSWKRTFRSKTACPRFESLYPCQMIKCWKPKVFNTFCLYFCFPTLFPKNIQGLIRVIHCYTNYFNHIASTSSLQHKLQHFHKRIHSSHKQNIAVIYM